MIKCKILTGVSDREYFSALLNDHLAEGWRLHGDLQMSIVPDGAFYAQMIVKEDKPEEQKFTKEQVRQLIEIYVRTDGAASVELSDVDYAIEELKIKESFKPL